MRNAPRPTYICTLHTAPIHMPMLMNSVRMVLVLEGIQLSFAGNCNETRALANCAAL